MVDVVKVTREQALFFSAMSGVTAPEAKSMRKKMWAQIRAEHGLPDNGKYKVQVNDPHGLNYMVICDKYTGQPVGEAHSGTPYGRVPVRTAISFLAVQWSDERAMLPPGAKPVGGGLFVQGEDLYFPIY